MRLGVILGSVRHASNTAGIASFVESIIHQSFPSITLEVIHLAQSPNHPLPFVVEDIIPAAHDLSSLPDTYVDPSVRAWSATVLSWDAVLVITPQYNWGIPAPLKNSFDHLFKEWVGKPAGIITLGGHGGSKCAEQLKVVMGGGMDMRLATAMVGIQLSKEVIRTAKRWDGHEEQLKQYEEEVRVLLEELVQMVETPQVVKEEA
ncbi:hypothetical protein EHS25_009794 [Saitozyma podzolica]|uniref:NADPH-dependent FMN reductase-like domain-containing protein n=1 Tax=Saitozyma podzolica TaxID=1890683 RepID=A0A427YK81_9TREE|nr:hypothetical protein EHS25_009794 [Saitozyma podzolica]